MTREKPEHSEVVSSISRAVTQDGYVVVPAVSGERLQVLHKELEGLVKKNNDMPLRADNFNGEPISGCKDRYQSTAKNFKNKEKGLRWTRVSDELGRDVAALLSLLFGDVGVSYRVCQPASLFSVGNSKLGTERADRNEGVQGAHRDYGWVEIMNAIKTAKKNRGRLYRAFGAVCSLEFGTKLRVFPGSHTQREEDIDYFSRFVDVDVPPGSLIVFADTLVHAGVGFVTSNLRQHFHLTADTPYRWQSVAPPGNVFSYARLASFDG